MFRSALISAVLAVVPSFAHAQPVQIHHYYVGVDTRATIPTGAYAGLPDPNLNRLTFLYGHIDNLPPVPSGAHYHAKGGYSYTGPNLGGSTAVNPYNGTNGVNNAVRDAGTFNLLPGTGSLAGRYVTGLDTADESGDLTLRSVDVLSTALPGTAEHFQYHSGSDRWITTLSAASLRLNLTSISPGLTVVDSNGNTLLQNPGDTFALGTGNTFSFTPIFAADTSTFVGSATFTLTDLNGQFGNSGQFVYNIGTVPEPTTLTLTGLASIGFAVRGWRATRRTKS